MRLKITLSSGQQPLTLPLQYNHILQAFIYDNISAELAAFLHEKGYAYEKRNFKLFVFSNLYGKYIIKSPQISFTDKITFWLCSPLDDVLAQFANSLFQKQLQLIGQTIIVEAVEIQRDNISGSSIKVRTLSPVTVYTTTETKQTIYYAPTDQEFLRQISQNLHRKYFALYPDADPNQFYGQLIPGAASSYQSKIVRYKNFIIKGWMGQFHLEGTPEFLRFALTAGLGSKNSQGFGCCEQII